MMYAEEAPSEVCAAGGEAGAAAPASCCTNLNRGGAKSELSDTAFRRAEKRYKLYRLPRRQARRQPAEDTDFTDVVDFCHLDKNTEENRRHIHVVSAGDSRGGGAADGADTAGEGARCFTFSKVPGLLVFPQVLSPSEQAALCHDAILEYGDSGRHPNILSTHTRQPRATSAYQPPMRWATLGFSYEWTSKTYSRDRYSSFPPALKERIQRLLRLVAAVEQDGFTCSGPTTYEPQTAIVNYYPVGSMMMCHQDISEVALEQPLVSLSLGCSAVFLMGGDTRDVAPTAFLLRSGDVAAFTGPARTAFHSTPRILDDCPAWLTVDGPPTREEEARYSEGAYHHCLRPDGGVDRVPVESFSAEERERYWRLSMRHMRVNINVRQVYSEPCPFLFTAAE